MAPTDSRLSGSALAVARSIPWRSVLVDLALVVAWFVAVSLVFAATGWPTWLYYLVVFGGVIGYSLGKGPSTAPDGT